MQQYVRVGIKYFEFLVLLIIAAVLLLGVPFDTAPQPPRVTEYPVPTTNAFLNSITAGPDGASGLSSTLVIKSAALLPMACSVAQWDL